MVLNALISSVPLNSLGQETNLSVWEGGEAWHGLDVPMCSIMQELRGSWLTGNPHLPTLLSRDENLDLALSKMEGEGCGQEVKARGPPCLVSCPLAAQQSGQWA